MRKSKIITDFTEMFKKEKDIWVQNVGKTQISLQFSVGVDISSVLIPRSKQPFNLSTYVPWTALKNSRDLRTILNRRPARLIPLTKQEVTEFFERLAKARNTTVDAEMERAFLEQSALMDHKAYVAPEEAEVKTVEERRVAAEASIEPEDSVTPRVIGLLQESHANQPQETRLSVRALREELEVMEDDLTPADLEYIIARAPKSVSKWAASLHSKSESSTD